jgi:hypothetical protein
VKLEELKFARERYQARAFPRSVKTAAMLETSEAPHPVLSSRRHDTGSVMICFDADQVGFRPRRSIIGHRMLSLKPVLIQLRYKARAALVATRAADTLGEVLPPHHHALERLLPRLHRMGV